MNIEKYANLLKEPLYKSFIISKLKDFEKGTNKELKKKLNQKHQELKKKVDIIRRYKYKLGNMLLSEKDDKRYDKLITNIKKLLEE